MAKHRPATRARRYLLPVLMISTLIMFLAPGADAAATTLTVTKTGNGVDAGSVTPGQTITYDITIQNGAVEAAANVILTDVTPANTTYEAGSATINSGAPIAGATNPFADGELITASLAASGSATASFRVTVNLPLTNGTQITNTATATADNAPAANDSTTHTVASTPGLTINKTSSPAEGGSVIPGATVTYTIAVTNDALATATATGVSVTDATPTNTTYVAGSTKLDGVAVADNASAPLNPLQDGQALPDMVPGSTHTFTFNVLVDKPLDNAIPIANTATLSHDQGPDTSNGATLTVQSAPALTIAKTSAPAEGGAVTPGTTIAYSIVVTNAASATEKAKQLKLVDPTPAYTTYVEGTAKVDGTALAGNGNPFNVPLTLSDLLPGASHTIVFSVKVDSPLAKGTVISNLAKVTGQNHADVQDGATHTVDSAPVMRVFLSALPKTGVKLEENDLITYTIVVQNDVAATESLRNVLVRDPVPDGTDFYEGSAKVDGVTVARPVEQAADTRLLAPGPFPGGYELGTMAPGTSHTLTYRVRVKATADTITNRVFVTADNASQVVVTATHRGPASGGAGGNGNGGNGNGGSGGTGTGGTGTSSGEDSLAFTGLDLARLLLLAMTLLLAGWTLVARGRAVQRQRADTVTDETPPSTGSAMVDRWVDAWFYPRARR
jgi:uncharacterized repeat protein (TIGR01451 family)